MQLISHEFSGEADLQAMAALAQAFPADNLHTVDLPYRFSSWAFDYPDNIRLWRNPNGELLAWAVMQTPFWAIDYAYRPDTDQNLHRQLLAWADGRAREIVDMPSGRPAWFVTVFTGQAGRMRDLEEAGFASQADVGENSWSKLFMQHATPLSVEDPALPPGFTVRSLAGLKEVEAYVEVHRAAFESTSMTTEWRARTLNHPDYTPEVDLIIVAPDGQVVAFCICWLNKDAKGEIQGQVEPLGVHPAFHKLGLGRAILLEGLRRLYLKGAKRIYVETDNYRNAAVNLYESVGFRVVKEVWVYRKDY